MVVHLDIDDSLIKRAMRLGGHRTKKAAVNEALDEYVQCREQKQIVSLFGTVNFDAQYDYKAQRRRR